MSWLMKTLKKELARCWRWHQYHRQAIELYKGEEA